MGKIAGIIVILPLLVGMVGLPVSCAGEPEAQGSKFLLSDYPTSFEEEVMIVVPENASQVVMEGAGAIAATLQELTGNEPPIKSDLALAESDKVSYNLILVGTPDSNAILEQIYNLANLTRVTEEYPGENRGILQILENPWNADRPLLMVAGSDEWGVRAGSVILANENKIKELSGETAVTEFVNGSAVMLPTSTLNSVMDYIEQNHPDAAAFINEGISWTRSSQTIRIGHTQNVYNGDGWTVSIGHSATAEPFLDVRAEYNDGAIVWVGMIKESVITESSYTAE